MRIPSVHVLTLLSLLLGALVALGAAAAPPGAAATESRRCPYGQAFYDTQLVSTTWHTTATHSDWATGGQRATVSRGKSATNRVRTINTTTDSFDIGAEYGPISAGYNRTQTATNDVTSSATVTLRQAFSARVPNGKSARQMRWAIQKVIKVRKWSYTSSCLQQTIYRATISAPAANGRFIWDLQDRRTNRPSCKVKGYPAYGSCPGTTN